MLVLISFDDSNPFQVFYFACVDTIAGLLLQKNNQNEEKPIACMSKALNCSDLKYHLMKKQAYALVMSLKHFMVYIGYSKAIAYVLHSIVKEIWKQQDCLDTRGIGLRRFRNIIWKLNLPNLSKV